MAMPRATKPPAELRTAVLSIRTTRRLKRAVEVTAGQEGRTVSQWIERTLAGVLEIEPARRQGKEKGT